MRVVAALIPFCLSQFIPLTSQLRAASDWKDAATELARKITSAAGLKASVALTVKNSSSLAEEDVVQVRRALRAEVRQQGARLAAASRAKATVQVTLGENFQRLVWIAEIQRGESRTVAMVSVDRDLFVKVATKTTSLALWKKPLLDLEGPILDLAELPASNEGEARLLVLEPEKVSQWGFQGPSWQLLRSAAIAASGQPRPRDLRGRLIVRTDQSFDAFLPGTKCSGATQPALSLECQASGEAWRLITGDHDSLSSNLQPASNYFDGGVLRETGKELKLPAFSSVALKAGQNRDVLIFAGMDGAARVYEQGPDALATIDGWGSEIAGLKTGCGSGWQVLATRPGDFTTPDAIQAYEIVDRRAVAVSAPVEFSGPVTALWSAADGTSIVAVSRNLETGRYEAFRLSASCGQ